MKTDREILNQMCKRLKINIDKDEKGMEEWASGYRVMSRNKNEIEYNKEWRLIYLCLKDEELHEIPKEINKFIFLEFLVLHTCNISKIENLNNLVKLKHLNLNFNSNIKKIQNLNNLNKLITFELYSDNINIEEFNNLKDLKELRHIIYKEDTIEGVNYIHNILKQIAEKQGRLDEFFLRTITIKKGISRDRIDATYYNKRVIKLKMQHCYIGEIFNEINELKYLEELDLSNNHISYIENIENLTNLKKLILKWNIIENNKKFWFCKYREEYWKKEIKQIIKILTKK